MHFENCGRTQEIAIHGPHAIPLAVEQLYLGVTVRSPRLASSNCIYCSTRICVLRIHMQQLLLAIVSQRVCLVSANNYVVWTQTLLLAISLYAVMRENQVRSNQKLLPNTYHPVIQQSLGLPLYERYISQSYNKSQP